MVKENKECDMQDVKEFLNLARSFVRQVELFESVELEGEYKDIVTKAVKNVNGKTYTFLNNQESS